MLIVKREIIIGVALWAVFTTVGAASTLGEIAISDLICPTALSKPVVGFWPEPTSVNGCAEGRFWSGADVVGALQQPAIS